jgi:hypothetical protein
LEAVREIIWEANPFAAVLAGQGQDPEKEMVNKGITGSINLLKQGNAIVGRLRIWIWPS